MRLNQGVKAPVFINKDYQGKKINLSEYHEKRILLSFFRRAANNNEKLLLYKIENRSYLSRVVPIEN